MKNLLKGWNIMRILYLLMGGMVMMQGFTEGQWFFSLIGAIMFIMGVFKLGCANDKSNCSVPVSKTDFSELNEDEITFTEIK